MYNNINVYMNYIIKILKIQKKISMKKLFTNFANSLTGCVYSLYFHR